MKRSEKLAEYGIAGLAFIACFAILLLKDPWYFLQDDNYAQFTPTLISGLELLYAGKGFPTYSAYQFLGTPTLSYSTYAFLSPVTHFAFLISKFILGNVYHFNSVFTFLHFLPGYFFFYQFLKLHRISKWLALIAALSFIFCGFNLVIVRSWYYVAPTVGFFPIFCYLISKWEIPNLTLRQKGILLLLFLIYLNSGNFQLFIYSILFLFSILFFNSKNWKYGFIACLKLAQPLALSFLLSAPLLISTFIETKNLNRSGCGGCGIADGFISLIGIPLEAAMPCSFGTTALRRTDTQFYQGGGILILFAFLFLLYRLIKYHKKPLGIFTHAGNIWALLFAFSYLMSLGDKGYLWNLQCQLPILSAFTGPVKFMFYLQFLGILIGTKMISLYFRKKKYTFLKYLYFIFMTISLIIHLFDTRQALYAYNIQTPYPKVEWHSKLKEKDQYRIFPLSPPRSFDLNYETCLGNNFTSAYQFISTDGYEPLNSISVNKFEYHPQYAIRYVIQSKHIPDMIPANTDESFRWIKNWQELDTVYQDDKIVVTENTKAERLLIAYSTDSSQLTAAFECIVKANGVDFLLSKKTITDATFSLNFVYRKGIRVFVNENEVSVYPDRYNRVSFSADKSASLIEMRYDPFCWQFYKQLISSQ